MAPPDPYTPQVAAEICKRLAAGESLLGICEDPVMPHRSTVYEWVKDDRDGFADKYAQARNIGLDRMADEVLAIADTPVHGVKTRITADGIETTEGDMIEHRRLQVDTRKWYLSKLAPKRYGDKLELSGPDGQPISAGVDAVIGNLVIALLERSRARIVDDGTQRQSLLGAPAGTTT